MLTVAEQNLQIPFLSRPGQVLMADSSRDTQWREWRAKQSNKLGVFSSKYQPSVYIDW